MTTLHPGVVLVDDHVLLRNGLAGLIRSFGRFEVLFEASDGKDLIRQLKISRCPDVILLDIVMPEMDGIEIIRKLRREFPTTKIIAISGGGHISGKEYLKIAEQLGVKKSLSKPFASAQLLDAVNEVLNED